jgi:hypothetical protein
MRHSKYFIFINRIIKMADENNTDTTYKQRSNYDR